MIIRRIVDDHTQDRGKVKQHREPPPMLEDRGIARNPEEHQVEEAYDRDRQMRIYIGFTLRVIV